MKEKEEFFSKNHKRLLTIATWAKYFAWIVLVFYIFSTFGRFIEIQSSYVMQTAQPFDLKGIFADNPLYAISMLVDVLSGFIKGIVYFLVLKGISLGLNMIVETDINYRDNKVQEEK